METGGKNGRHVADDLSQPFCSKTMLCQVVYTSSAMFNIAASKVEMDQFLNDLQQILNVFYQLVIELHTVILETLMPIYGFQDLRR